VLQKRVYVSCIRADLRGRSKLNTEVNGKILDPRFSIVSAHAALALQELELPTDAAILDVGTGQGYFAISLALRGYRVLTGEPSTDKSRYAGRAWAENAKEVGVLDSIRFEAFDAGKMPFDSEAFDAVFFYGVLHHIDEGVRSDVFSEALRVSKQNGVVVFFEPRKEMLERIWVDDPGHPLAANPSNYLPGHTVIREHRVAGPLMDILVYQKAADGPRC